VAITRDGVVTKLSTVIDRMDMDELTALAQLRLAAFTDPGEPQGEMAGSIPSRPVRGSRDARGGLPALQSRRTGAASA
jgi:hypothetical protein